MQGTDQPLHFSHIQPKKVRTKIKKTRRLASLQGED